MKTYYCTLYPNGWFNVFREGCNNAAGEPCNTAGVMNGYKDAVARDRKYINMSGERTSIYVYNNSYWYKGEAQTIYDFIKQFFDILYKI